MAVQLPEPDFYTLDEVIERWQISRDILLRLGLEGKITISVSLVDAGLISVNQDFNPRTSAGVAALFSLDPADMEFGTDIYSIGDLSEIALEDIPKMDIEKLFEKRVREREEDALRFWAAGTADLTTDSFERCHPLEEKIIHPELCNISHYLRADGTRAPLPKPSKPLTYFASNFMDIDFGFPFQHLVLRSEEIRRVEGRHEAAQQAAAQDILGAKEKETLEGIVASLAVLLAEKSPRLKHGTKPNAAQIAEAIRGTNLTERSPDTIRKVISKALDHFLG
ncbi:hypothetical protein HF668_02530 [Acidithiobacillus ferridurans]|uniref:hypothetical protein n=1 Tax=Acidithiobacillus ferridurans TaxID=1232575 RepID=UPI001C0766C4|nr:hypothetical protein [Acidithiobacillus ferridurans]MBU2804053.1 hypothetical protein [Acidithiobacillus ferridurans]